MNIAPSGQLALNGDDDGRKEDKFDSFTQSSGSSEKSDRRQSGAPAVVQRKKSTSSSTGSKSQPDLQQLDEVASVNDDKEQSGNSNKEEENESQVNRNKNLLNLIILELHIFFDFSTD